MDHILLLGGAILRCYHWNRPWIKDGFNWSKDIYTDIILAVEWYFMIEEIKKWK